MGDNPKGVRLDERVADRYGPRGLQIVNDRWASWEQAKHQFRVQVVPADFNVSGGEMVSHRLPLGLKYRVFLKHEWLDVTVCDHDAETYWDNGQKGWPPPADEVFSIAKQNSLRNCQNHLNSGSTPSPDPFKVSSKQWHTVASPTDDISALLLSDDIGVPVGGNGAVVVVPDRQSMLVCPIDPLPGSLSRVAAMLGDESTMHLTDKSARANSLWWTAARPVEGFSAQTTKFQHSVHAGPELLASMGLTDLERTGDILYGPGLHLDEKADDRWCCDNSRPRLRLRADPWPMVRPPRNGNMAMLADQLTRGNAC